MLAILFSKFTLAYVILALSCEYLTRYGFYIFERIGNKTVLSFATTLGYAVLLFNIAYSAATHWYVSILLLFLQVVFFVIVDNVVRKINKDKEKIKGKIENEYYYSSLHDV